MLFWRQHNNKCSACTLHYQPNLNLYTHVIEDWDNNSADCVQFEQSTHNGEQNSQHLYTRQRAQQRTADRTDYDVNNNGNNKRFQVFFLSWNREQPFKQIHAGHPNIQLFTDYYIKTQRVLI